MSNIRITWLAPQDPPDRFPDVAAALREPDGLLAAGGDLSSARLLAAYRAGIFPWYDDGQPILWWSPDPRCVIRPADFRLSRRTRQYAAKSDLTVSFNRAFADVIQACAGERRSQQGTWITPDMMDAFRTLHREGWAHSVEIHDGGTLVGGLYGLAIGRVFFGESMFSSQDNASKFAMLALTRVLARHQFTLLDCQVLSQHLVTLGAVLMPRAEFTTILDAACTPQEPFVGWPGTAQPIRDYIAK